MRLALVVITVIMAMLVGCGDGESMMTPDAMPSADANLTVLSESGLYSDFAARTVAPEYREYAPAYQLWADDASKRRWVSLPAGQTIDVSDPDHWTFPVGTRVWKEFRIGDKVLETRLIEKRGVGEYRFAVYVWRDDGSDADLRTGGAVDVRGTAHDVPTSSQCLTCHLGEPDRYLGLSAIQLSPPSTALAAFNSANLFSAAVPAVTIPGDDATRAAFGVLHANCGHCHNPNGSAYGQVNMVLRIAAGESGGTAEATQLYQTTVGVATTSYRVAEDFFRISKTPSMSAIAQRMLARGSTEQMPPFATEVEDMAGRMAILAWMTTLP